MILTFSEPDLHYFSSKIRGERVTICNRTVWDSLHIASQFSVKINLGSVSDLTCNELARDEDSPAAPLLNKSRVCQPGARVSCSGDGEDLVPSCEDNGTGAPGGILQKLHLRQPGDAGVLLPRLPQAWVNILPRNPYDAISTFFENLIFLTTPAPLFSGKCNKKPNTRPFFEHF